VWNGEGQAPVNADGSPEKLPVQDTTALRKELAPTMRSLMRALAQPPSS
jgi:hypothetical protein